MLVGPCDICSSYVDFALSVMSLTCEENLSDFAL